MYVCRDICLYEIVYLIQYMHFVYIYVYIYIYIYIKLDGISIVCLKAKTVLKTIRDT